MHALGGLIAAVPSGFLIDRIGRRPVLILGPLLMALSSILTALAGSFTQLLAYRFIGGAAMEMWRQARLAMVADVGKQRQRGRQMTGMIGTEGAGRLIGPALGGVLAGWSIRVPFVVHGFLSVVAILPSIFLLRESAPNVNAKTTDSKDSHLNYPRRARADVGSPVPGIFLRAILRLDDSRRPMGRHDVALRHLCVRHWPKGIGGTSDHEHHRRHPDYA